MSCWDEHFTLIKPFASFMTADTKKSGGFKKEKDSRQFVSSFPSTKRIFQNKRLEFNKKKVPIEKRLSTFYQKM